MGMNGQVDAHWFWKEAINRLESLRLRVKEGRDLDPALDFCRFILWSHIDKLLLPYQCDGELKVDVAYLRWKAEDLQREVQILYSTGKAAADANRGTMEAILHRLDLIAGHVAKFAPPATETATVGDPPPALQVIQGGAK